MDKTNKYYKLIVTLLKLFVLNILLGQIKNAFVVLDYTNTDVAKILFSLFTVFRWFAVIMIIAGCGYLGYVLYKYYTSLFYRKYKVSAAKCLFMGYLDFYEVYDCVTLSKNVRDVEVDFNVMSIFFTNTDEKSYSIVFRDIFGKIKGDLRSDYWRVVSRPKKQYGDVRYRKEIKIPNPYKLNQNNINMKQTEVKYSNFVLINGFYTLLEKNEKIISTFELMEFIGNK